MAKKQKKSSSTQEPPSLQNLIENSRKYLPNNSNKSPSHYFRPSSADSNTKAGILQRPTDTNPFDILNRSASMSPPSSAGTDYSNNDLSKNKKRKPRKKKNKRSTDLALSGNSVNTTRRDTDEDVEMEVYNSDIDDTDSEMSVDMAPTATTFDSTEDSDTRSWNEVCVRRKQNRWEPKMARSATRVEFKTPKHLIHSPPCSSPLRFNVYSLSADKASSSSQRVQSKADGEADVLESFAKLGISGAAGGSFPHEGQSSNKLGEAPITSSQVQQESQALENEDPEDCSQIARLIAATCFSERLPPVPDNLDEVLVEKSQTWEDLNPEGDVWAALEADLMSREGNWENYER
ncbi:hypothetical protein WICPIJ_004064, partial [Wickerhamomyces pijperi]